MLGTLPTEKKQHLGNYIATGCSPYTPMFGIEARLPIDLVFGTSADDISLTSHTGYVESLWEKLKQAPEN